MFGRKSLEYTAPDGAFSLVLPRGWTLESTEDQIVFSPKKGVGTLRVSAWRTGSESGGLERFLSRKEEQLRQTLEDESQVPALERIAMKDRKGLFRISLAEEAGVPLAVTAYVLGGGTTVVVATYTLPFAAFKTEQGKEEQSLVTDALLRMTLR